MSNLYIFKPLNEVTVDENIDAFINFAKRITLFGKDLNWNSMKWDISNHVSKRGVSHKSHIIWSNFESAKIHSIALKKPLSEPFVSFAKAYIVYTQSLQKINCIPQEIFSMRVLEFSLVKCTGNSHIKNISYDVLNYAAFVIKENYVDADLCLFYLQKIYNFICDNKLCLSTLPWSAPVVDKKVRPTVGDQAVKNSKIKCPTDSCLKALATIFNKPSDDVDVFASSLALILLAQPCRIGEVLALPFDCEVESSLAVSGYGLRWEPLKRGKETIKQILPSWIDLVKEAIANIKSLTDESRKMAFWYENNPKKMYLPDEYVYYHDCEYIKLSDVRKILRMPSVAAYYLKVYKRSFTEGRMAGLDLKHYEKCVLKSDLDQLICSMLPKNFPYWVKEIKLKYSDSLFVVPHGFFSKKNNAYSSVMFTPVGSNQVRKLYGEPSKTTISIFVKNNLYESDGSQIHFKTHSARHWQNTVANYNHVPEFFIAMWSGRKLVSQNAAYYHTTPEERFEQILETFEGDSFLTESDNEASTEISEINVVGRLEFINNSLQEIVGTAHITNTGFCLHDFTSLPCDKLGNHVVCSEHLYLKGDPRNHLLRDMLAEEEALLKRIESQSADDLYGIDLAYTSKLQRVRILRNIVSILDNEEVPNNSFYCLEIGNEYDPIKVAVYNKTGEIIGNNSSDTNLSFLKHITIEEGL